MLLQVRYDLKVPSIAHSGKEHNTHPPEVLRIVWTKLYSDLILDNDNNMIVN
jgi:hypothetical protein